LSQKQAPLKTNFKGKKIAVDFQYSPTQVVGLLYFPNKSCGIQAKAKRIIPTLVNT